MQCFDEKGKKISKRRFMTRRKEMLMIYGNVYFNRVVKKNHLVSMHLMDPKTLVHEFESPGEVKTYGSSAVHQIVETQKAIKYFQTVMFNAYAGELCLLSLPRIDFGEMEELPAPRNYGRDADRVLCIFFHAIAAFFERISSKFWPG